MERLPFSTSLPPSEEALFRSAVDQYDRALFQAPDLIEHSFQEAPMIEALRATQTFNTLRERSLSQLG